MCKCGAINGQAFSVTLDPIQQGIPTTSKISITNFNNDFLQAIRNVTPSSDNLVASPVSALVLLSALLVANGPRGNTAVEICKAILGRRFDVDCRKGNFLSVEKNLKEIREAVESARPILTLANAAFVDPRSQLNSDFTRRFIQHPGDLIAAVNFTTSNAFNRTNKWVDETTGGLIKQLFKKKQDIDATTILMLLNVVTFKSTWRTTFNSNYTKISNFSLHNGSRVPVPMMRCEEKMIYYTNDSSYSFVAKPFSDPRFKFVVAMPEQDSNLKNLEKVIEGGFPWSEVDNNKNFVKVLLRLPKFTVESDIDMRRPLETLGIKDLFIPGNANLTGISKKFDLYASSSKQVAVMKINESGVEAAAVTSASIVAKRASIGLLTFTVNRPFYCAIYDSVLQIPLFVARIMDPR